MRIVGLSGSLRARSSTAAVLRAAARVAPAGVALDVDDSLGALPHFNPDLDEEGMTPPPAVAALRARLAAADAILVCTPEYAHGVPGALKDALDWLVSDAALVGKRVAVVGTGPAGAPHAQAQLVETLKTMSWQVVPDACASFALGRAQLDAAGELADPEVLARLGGCIANLIAFR